MSDVGVRSTGALFIALVAAILGAMPGWTLTFLAWTVPCWLVLACATAWTLVLLAGAALRHDRIALRTERRQLLALVLVLAVMPWLGRLATGVELAQVRAELRARADASARAGGPRLAISTTEEEFCLEGFLYDETREVERPPARRDPAWTASTPGRLLAGEGVVVKHLLGPYYHWVDGCGAI